MVSLPPHLDAASVLYLLPFKIKEVVKQDAVQRFIFDNLQAIGKNTAAVVAGSYYDITYKDLMDSKKRDTRTAEDVLKDIIAEAGLEVI